MDREPVAQLRAEDARVQALLRRHFAFWERAADSGVLYVTTQSNRWAPPPFYLRQADGSFIRSAERLTPDMFDVAAMVAGVADWEPALEHGAWQTQADWLIYAGVGDLLPLSRATPKIPWVEAMLGCPISLNDGEIWIKPYPGDPEEIIGRGANFEHNPWFQLYLEFLRQFQARLGERFPMSPNTLIRGAGDLCAAALGVQEACLAWAERPALMARLLRVCTDAVLQMVAAGNKLTPRFQGGYPSGYALLAPGPAVSTQDDHANLISGRMYGRQIMPYTREIIESCPYSIIHLHSGGLHLVPQLLEIPALKAIEVAIDSPPAEGRRGYEIQMMQKILEHKALYVHFGPPNLATLADYQGLLEQLPQRGLALNAAFEPDIYRSLPAGFPGAQVWMLQG